MNGDEIKYLRQMIAYCSMLLFSGIVVSVGYLSDPLWVTAVLYAVGVGTLSFCIAHYEDGYNRRVWGLVMTWEHPPLEERRRVLEDGEEL